ncbi:B3 domain-containing transcription factor FUS3-like [Rutidosis leptorrhynchoides]|uniref:B3 domain-containing transcription factor FUS3-like n=1 Tax=Rutidosis leptorrhynchoides TaxID=125765 RepID=UPI003A99C313
MERNEACGLSAFGGCLDIDMGMGMGIDFVGVDNGDNNNNKNQSFYINNDVDVDVDDDDGKSSNNVDEEGDLVAAAKIEFLKKKRMPRFRGTSSDAVHRFRSFTPFVTPLRTSIVDDGRLTFLFSKKLQKSDVGVLKRIVLPKKPTETHLPNLVAKEGMILEMDDMDTMHTWCFKFRYWPNNNSRMYVLEGTGEFAEEHGLQVGDFIMMYRDSVNKNYVIHAVKGFEVNEYGKKEVEPNLRTQVDQSSGKAPAQHNTTTLMNQNCPWTGLDIELFNPINYPINYYPMNAPTVEDQMGMNFVYDTSYSNDFMTPLDFLGGFMSSYPTAQPNFAIDNLSIDDLYKI